MEDLVVCKDDVVLRVTSEMGVSENISGNR